MLSQGDSLVYLYMDDLIIVHQDPHKLPGFLVAISHTLIKGGFMVAPEKIQRVPPFKVLDTHLSLKLVP